MNRDKGIRTRPPAGGAMVVLYDGHCRFCTAQAQRIARVVGASRIALRSFQDAGVLSEFPCIPYETAMQRIHVVAADGRVFAGAEGVARALMLVPVFGAIAWCYYLPVIHVLCETIYAVVARRRYRGFILRMARREESVCNGACDVHMRRDSRRPSERAAT